MRLGIPVLNNFVDVDQHMFSTADGHVTVVVLATLSDAARVHAVGDHVPDYCLGNPTYRMITVINFNQKRTRAGRFIATMLVRRRLDAEAKLLQRRYDAKKLARDAREITGRDVLIGGAIGLEREISGKPESSGCPGSSWGGYALKSPMSGETV